MANADESEQRELLNDQSNVLGRSPPLPPPLTANINSPLKAAPRRRPVYARIPSIPVINESVANKPVRAHGGDDIHEAPYGSDAGLGIAIGSEEAPLKARRVSIQSVPRPSVVGTKGTPEQQTPSSADPLMSPYSGRFSGSTHYDPLADFESLDDGNKHVSKQSISSLHSASQPSAYASGADFGSKHHYWDPLENCPSWKPVNRSIGSCFSIVILSLTVFSTIFSAAFLIIALHKPRYGRMIRTNGTLTASSAAFLTSFMAKLVELSFVTVMVAFIGQALARRALRREVVRGVTLAELSMRTWVMQPGTLLTQWQSVRYAGVSVLGIIAFIAALSTVLYTSAATALVQPQLKFPDWAPVSMKGLVKTSFANPDYIQDNCQTPILSNYDTESGRTCIQLEHAAMAYHNYFAYLGTWKDLDNNGTGTPDLSSRPKGFALLDDNTTVTAPWVEQTNVTELYQSHNIIINNVSMAMPHPGVIQAAIDHENNIMQPAELDGLGMYNIIASIPSPVVHVLCVTLTSANLEPFVYQLWPDADLTDNTTDMSIWPEQLSYANPYLNETPYHDIFQWGPKYGASAWPPVFANLPIDYNTVINDTQNITYGRDSIYLLGKGGPADSVGTPTEDLYGLCQLKVSQTPNCSTHYNVSSGGGTLEAVCEDPHDEMRYIKSLQNATSGNISSSRDWPNIASEWSRSLALNDGIFDGNGTNPRLLTELILTTPQLNKALPSMAEALAVMAGCTLLSSATDSPFVEFWNYSESTISGQYQYFNASIRAQQYASGGTQRYQYIFYPILFTVFFMSLAALIYFCAHRDWYTDFSDPTNLFSLAMNSPPSKQLAGSCGGGPVGEQFKVSWKLNRTNGHLYMEHCEVEEGSPKSSKKRLSQGFDVLMTPLRRASSTFEKLML